MGMTIEERMQRARSLRKVARRIQLANPSAARIIRAGAKKIELRAARALGKGVKRGS
ncbi:hypothetical protein LCGC14_1983900 [marine sediment metagenome]|uniref:Uncharacterized protein n=1 Tax=marine sediment metagenome TaxID=412755 RepID=A0A0F9F8A9_9ZZZZ